MIDKDDPKLTAFALGELVDEDFSAIEAEINSSAELLTEVEAIRKIADEVGEILLAEQYLDIAVDIPRKIDIPAVKPSHSGYYVTGIAIAMVCVIFVTIIIQNINKNEIAVFRPTLTPENKVEDNYALPQKNSGTNKSGQLANLIKDQEKSIENNTIETLDELKIKNNQNEDISDFLINGVKIKRTAPILNYKSETNRDYGQNSNSTNQNQNTNSNVPVVINSDNYSNDQNIVKPLELHGQIMCQDPICLLESNRSYKQNEILNNIEKNNIALENKSTFAGKTTSPTPNIAGPKNLPFFSPARISDVSDNGSIVGLSAYQVMCQSINSGKLPSVSEIKIDEYVNNFRYNYSVIKNDQRFVIQTDMIQCPWNAKHLIARVGVKMLADKTGKWSYDNKADSSAVTNANRNDDHLKTVVRFDKSKIKSYLPINSIGIESVAEINTKNFSKGNKKTEHSAIIGTCDISSAIGLHGEVMLLYEIIPVDQEQNNANEKSNLNQQDRLLVNDYFSVELQEGEDLYSDKEQMTRVDAPVPFHRLQSKVNIIAGNKENNTNETITGETQFAVAVVLFGLLLQNGGVMENCDWNTVISLAMPNIKNNEQRKEFLKIVEKAAAMTTKSPPRKPELQKNNL
ncbi:MAG: von Willebrand factor type A domain-containing protein [Planctomycetaceae bacterium]|jgi:hypothetical protein|nr:von Willebrand factor type A domain-containing protein [Planctomycetaceae bacterium]